MITRETRRRGDIEWHEYKCALHGDYTGYPGATTVLNKKAKPALGDWFKRQGALAAVRQRQALDGLVEMSGEDAVVRMLASAADKLRDDAGDRGTRVHAVVEADLKGLEPVILPDIAAHVEGWRRWATEAWPRIIASEFMVISETHGYGATGDVVAEFDDALWLLDVKTGGAWPETALQLAAIRWADHGEDGKPPPQATRFGVLEVHEDGTRLREYLVTEADFEAFLGCMTLYRWDKERSRKVMAT